MSEPIFGDSVLNPFGLKNSSFYWSFPFTNGIDFVDIDSDNDLDVFINDIFFKNIGTSRNAVFVAPIENAFGLMSGSVNSAFVDIDQDGDVDAFMSQPNNGDILFYKNTGNKNQPLFSAPVTNPFGLSNTKSYSSPTFADIDSDGDMDAFVGEYNDVIFFRNTGNATAASFVKSNDNLGLNGGLYNTPIFTDIDDDGDLDAFIGTGNYDGGGLNFFRNIGTVDNPVFYADSASRFSLIDTNC